MREGKRNRFIWIAKEIQNAGFLCAHSGVHHIWIYENDKRGVTFISAGFIVSGCVLAGLIGALFL